MPTSTRRPRLEPIDLDPSKMAWEKQPGESTDAYRAFLKFRDLPASRRKLFRVAMLRSEEQSPGYTHALSSRLGISVEDIASAHVDYGAVGSWRAKFRWDERVDEWDSHLQDIADAKTIEEQVEMQKRHIDLARMALDKAFERIADMNPSELKGRDLSQLIDVAVKVERLARNMSTEKKDSNVSGPKGGPIQVETKHERSKAENELISSILRNPAALDAAESLLSVLEANPS